MSAAKHTHFDYLLNALEEASLHDQPATRGYAEKRAALFEYVRDLERGNECAKTLLTGLRMAQKHGGKRARMEVADVINVIEAFQRGDMDDGAPITGPFYPRSVQ